MGRISPESQRGAVSVNRLSIPVVSGLVALAAIVSWTIVGVVQYSSMRAEYTAGHNELAAAQAKGFNELAAQIREVQYKLELQEARMSDRYTATDHKRFLLDLLRNNPTLKLPEKE